MSIVEGLLQFLNKVNDIISKKKTRRVRTLDIALKNAKVGQKVREIAVTAIYCSPPPIKD